MQAAQIRLVATSTLLATSGVLTVAAAAQRWWPHCKVGAFDTGPCSLVQDSRYNYQWPRDPWTPLGVAAELQGLAMLPLALAVLLLPGVLTARRPGLLMTLAALLVSAGMTVSGIVTFLSGRAGEVVTLPALWPFGTLWAFGLPALVMVAVSVLIAETDRPPVWEWGRWSAAGCLMLSSPGFALLLAPFVFLYISYDTTPWSEALPGVLHIAAAAILWRAVHRDRRLGADVADDSASATHAGAST